MKVASIPRARLARTGEKRAAVRPVPMNAIAAVGKIQICNLRKSALETDIVRRSAVDCENPEHEAFIPYSVDIIKLRLVPDRRIGKILVVGGSEEDDVFLCPLRIRDEVHALAVGSFSNRRSSETFPDVAMNAYRIKPCL